MPSTGQYQTFDFGASAGAGVNREDLLDVIYNIAPYDTPAYSIARKGQSYAHTHEWPEDTLVATSTAATIQGAAFGCATAQQIPTRATNVHQIFRADIEISMTQLAVVAAGIGDFYRYQVMNRLKEIKRNCEARIFSASGNSATGASGTATTMAAAADFLSGTAQNAFHADATALGGNGIGTATSTALSETVFNGLLEQIYTDGGDPHDVFVSPNLKRQISQFAANQTRVVSATDRTLVNSIDVYWSDFGQLVIHPDRWILQSTATAATDNGTNQSLFVLDRNRYGISYLRRPRHVPVATVGDAIRGMVLKEATLEVMNAGSTAAGGAHGRLWGLRQT